MKKVGAIGILTTILFGLAAWAGTQIVDNAKKIVKLETEVQTSKELLKEIRDDVKLLLRK